TAYDIFTLLEFRRVLFRSDGTSTRRHSGAGLGLAISRRLVKAMGGDITASSQLGEGSKFAFEIPATDAAEPAIGRETVLTGYREIGRASGRRKGKSIVFSR